VDDFFLRLSCANGAVARNLNTAFEFGQGQDAFRKLLESMTGWSKAGFVPRTFETRLEGAIRTKASYGELERVMNSVIGQIHDEDVNALVISCYSYFLSSLHFFMLVSDENSFISSFVN
jgi:hypothetical protein